MKPTDQQKLYNYNNSDLEVGSPMQLKVKNAILREINSYKQQKYRGE